MKFLRDFFRRTPGRFVAEDVHRQTLSNQLQMIPQTLEQLQTHGVDSRKALRLEYFFYTNTSAKAESLAGALRDLSYSPECGPSASDKRESLVTGWTPAMVMNTEIVSAWTQQMSELGFAHDCEFDGWGTNPEQ